MIRIGQHADNLRALQRPFKDAFALTKKLGIEYLETGIYYGEYFVTALDFEPSINLADNPLVYRKMAEEAGITFTQMDCASPMFELVGTTRGLYYTTQAMRFGKELGAVSVATTDRGTAFEGYTEEYAWDYGVKNYTELLKWAESYKMGVNIETHGVYTQNTEFFLKFMKHFESEYLGINFDTGNVFIAGNDPLETLKALYPYVRHMHIKDVDPALADASRGEDTGIATSFIPVGKGCNAENIEKCLRFMKEKNWDGNISIECAGTEENVAQSYAWVKSIVED